MKRAIFDDEHLAFRQLCHDFLLREAAPHTAEWEAAGIVDRLIWKQAGETGLLGFEVPEEFGGAGIKDFRYNAILSEEITATGSVGVGFTLHNDICAPYLLTLTNDEQKARWLPGFASGELITAIGMTEPSTGSDLQAIRTTARPATNAEGGGDGWILNGSKTFITNGIHSDLVIVVAKTDPEAGHRGMSLLVVERGMPGFERGRNLAKAGQHAQDTAELFFSDVHVPRANLLGEEGRGFIYLMENLPQERLSIAVAAVAGMERAIELTRAYASERTAFGKPVGTFQASRFAIAEMVTKTRAARSYVDQCILSLNVGDLTADEAAGVKYWTTDVLAEVADAAVQLHGGYGYMDEYEVSRIWRDARVTRIYGGTNEIMKEIVGRSLGF
ncbi:MAG TPA: acyl-CoA dehydrogenase family protein [Frankiaceae bacterium]|nr:acyl-CoA dehydrogenase family protein [Frankiaceae bacterium]